MCQNTSPLQEKCSTSSIQRMLLRMGCLEVVEKVGGPTLAHIFFSAEGASSFVAEIVKEGPNGRPLLSPNFRRRHHPRNCNSAVDLRTPRRQRPRSLCSSKAMTLDGARSGARHEWTRVDSVDHADQTRGDTGQIYHDLCMHPHVDCASRNRDRDRYID